VRKRVTKVKITKWAIILGGATCLEIVARAGMVRRATLIPVSEMFIRLWKFAVTGEIPARFLKDSSIAGNFFMTFAEILLSFSLAVLVGLPVGILLWKFKTLARILNPYLISYYAIPIFALYPLFVALFGVGMFSIVLMGWLFAVVAIIINTDTGFQKVDKEIYPKVGRSLGLSRSEMFLWIYFPAATPYIFTGLKLGFIYSLIGVIASEFIISTRGLGHLVSFSYSAFDTENMYASMLLIILIAVFINGLLLRMEAWIYGRRGR